MAALSISLSYEFSIIFQLTFAVFRRLIISPTGDKAMRNCRRCVYTGPCMLTCTSPERFDNHSATVLSAPQLPVMLGGSVPCSTGTQGQADFEPKPQKRGMTIAKRRVELIGKCAVQRDLLNRKFRDSKTPGIIEVVPGVVLTHSESVIMWFTLSELNKIVKLSFAPKVGTHPVWKNNMSLPAFTMAQANDRLTEFYNELQSGLWEEELASLLK